MNTKSRRRSFTPLEKVHSEQSSLTGFTLIELLMVIGIIIILAGIFMPNFAKARERALTKEAFVNLKLIAAAEKAYRMENGFYYPNPCPPVEGDIADINDNLKLYFTNETYWDYTITAATAGPPPTFTATAVRTAGSYIGCTFTITESTPGDPPQTAGTCP